MNKIILMGRLTRNPEISYSNTASRDGSQLAIARYSIAVDRRFKAGDGVDVDFFNCVSFGKQAEFAEKYLQKGTKIAITGRLQNDNYTNKDGVKVTAVKVMVEEVEFAESKSASQQNQNQGGYEAAPQDAQPQAAGDEYMSVPAGMDLPFK